MNESSRLVKCIKFDKQVFEKNLSYNTSRVKFDAFVRKKLFIYFSLKKRHSEAKVLIVRNMVKTKIFLNKEIS